MSPDRNQLGVWELTSSAGQYKVDEATRCTTYTILKQSTPTTGHRVLLSGGSNHFKLNVFSMFRVLMCDLRVLSLRFLPAEQLNRRN
jgi:hypothetical protein